MVTITASANVAFDMYETGLVSALSQSVMAVSLNTMQLARGDNYEEMIEGAGFGLSEDGDVISGTVTRITEFADGVKAFEIDGLSTSAASLYAWGDQRDSDAFFAHALAGNDLINGSNLDDRLFSGGGNDVIKAGAGDDEIDAGSGYNIIDGGDGNDTVILAGDAHDYTLLQRGGFSILSSASDRLKLSNVEAVYFANGDLVGVSDLSTTVQAFNALAYIASYADLRHSFGLNTDAAATHYALYGFDEGRDPNLFNPLAYIAAYSDLRAVFGLNSDAATRHYILYGADEGRSSRFDGMAYLASYSDLRAAFGSDVTAATKHYILYGANEGRTLTFDAGEYLASNPNLLQSLGYDPAAATKHFVMTGAAEGLATDSFSALAYIASYSDLIGAFGMNAWAGKMHFLTTGAAEGREVTFDALAYAHAYSDLEAAFGDNVFLLTQHYILYGIHEGRTVPVSPEPFT